MNNKYITLSPRLEQIASLVPKCDTVADIGTDHAYIPVRLIQTGRAKRAIASDIKKGPVARAKDTVKKYAFEDEIDVRLGAGLETVKPLEAEVTIIAGMGGILISDILNASLETVRSARCLILQPMTAVYELRKYLSENNFFVDGEYLVQEEDKIYNILTVRPNENCDYSLKELYLGKNIEKTSPDLYPAYRKKIITKLNKRADGLKKSPSEKNKKTLETILHIINEIS